MLNLKTRVHQLVKDLHNLNNWTIEQQDHFESAFENVLAHLLDLVSFKDKHKVRITIRTSQFPEFQFTCYCNVPRHDTSEPDLRQLAQYKPSNHRDSIFHSLIRNLSNEGHFRSRRPKREYNQIISEISRFFELLMQLYDASRLEISEFLSQCLSYEYALALDLDQNFEKASNTTEQLMDALDGLMGKLPSEDHSDSIFDYKASSSSQGTSKELLNFESSDSILNQAYESLLRLALLKPASLFSDRVTSFVKVILQLLENHYLIEVMQVPAVEEEKIQLVYELFLGSDRFSGLVSRQWMRVAEEILDSTTLWEGDESSFHIPEIEGSNNFLSHIDTTLNAKGYLKEELAVLVSNLNTVVNLLNEFDPQFDPHFAQVFKTFIDLVYFDLLNLATAQDYTYIEKLTELVHQISEYESNEDIMEGDVIRGIIESLHFMQGFLTSGYHDSTLLMRLSTKVSFSDFKTKKATFRRWNDKTVTRTHLDMLYQQYLENSKEEMLQRSLTTWYNKYKKFVNLSSQAENYSRKKLVARILKDSWIQKLVEYGDFEYQSQKFHSKRMYDNWVSKMRGIQKMKKTLMKFYKTNILTTSFMQLKHRYQRLQNNESKAVDFYHEFEGRCGIIIKKFILKRWHEMLDSKFITSKSTVLDSRDFVLSKKLIALSDIEKRTLLIKYFRFWLRMRALSQLSSKADMNNRRLKKYFFFGVWRRALALHTLSRSFTKKSERELKLSAIKLWTERKNQKLQALKFYRENLLRVVFKKWNLKHRKFGTSQMLLKVEVFKLWKLRTLSLDMTKKLKKKVLQQSFSTWVIKYRRNRDNLKKAFEVRTQNLKRAALTFWITRARLHEEYLAVAELNVQRRIVQNWKKRYVLIKSLERMIKSFQGGRSLYDKQLLRVFFELWRSQMQARFEIHTRDALLTFENSVRRKGTILVFFRYWKRRSKNAHSRQVELGSRLAYFERISLLHAPLFSHWKERLDQYQEFAQMSDEFYKAVLNKKFLLVWYERLVLKVNYLDELAENVLSQKEYVISSEYLQKWNLKYVKTYKRNLQTCEMFKEKWNLSKARSFLQMWNYKTFNKETARKDKDADHFIEGNTSVFYSSLSPLAKKRGSFLDGHSYLHTPVKKQISQPFTPSSRIRRTSPSRLLDTTLKMTSDKMGALINHYKRARGKQKGLYQAGSMNLQYSANLRLSPPRPSTTYSQLPTKPPAPRFETILSLDASPEATSSPFEPRGYKKIPSPLPLADIDSSILSTAKKLKRFRPLIVPHSEKEADMSASPAAQLKERLDHAANSVNSSMSSRV